MLQDNKAFWISWGRWYILSNRWRRSSLESCIKRPNTRTNRYIGTRKLPNRSPGFCKIDLEFFREKREKFWVPRQFLVFLIFKIRMKKEIKWRKSAMNRKIFIFIQISIFFFLFWFSHVLIFILKFKFREFQILLLPLEMNKWKKKKIFLFFLL